MSQLPSLALIECNAWEGPGIKSPAHWRNYHCGIDLGAAREKVRVAKSLSALPAIDEAFRCGTISYSKVRAMTRSATPENEQMLLLRGRMTPEDSAVFMKAVEAMVAAGAMLSGRMPGFNAERWSPGVSSS